MSASVVQGDCRQWLSFIPDNSVHCCVTSPPYFGLRDYGVSGQIGLEPTLDAYVAEMVAVFREVRRVLRVDGTLFLNLGDSYATSGARQTGRNDTNRETPGGRGGSFRGGVRRAIACDKPGKAPVSSQERGCLCGNLCGACRAAYRIGKSHSNNLRAPMQPLSSGASSRARIESQSDHAPMSGWLLQHDRNSAAIPNQPLSVNHAAAPPLASLASTSGECVPLPPASHLEASIPAAGCQLCGRSLLGCAPQSVHMADCTCDTEGDELVGRQKQNTGLKPKDLMMVPARVALALQADGWWLRKDIIWHKPNPLPESCTDRPTSSHEHVFLLTKAATYFYDAEAIKEPAIQGERYHGAYDKRPGATRERNGRADAVNVTDTRNCRDVWTIAPRPFKGAHFATMPPALVEPCILAGCPKGGTVLDPFGGAGTVGLVADRLGRNAILIELNPAYAEIAANRLAKASAS